MACEERRHKHQLLLDLRKAALEGDVADDIMGLMRNNRKLLGAAITEEHETVFHIAAGAKQTHFVEQMIKLIGEEQKDYLKFQNKQCNTAFCFAAMAGSKEIAQAMLNKDESLLTIRGGKGMTPLYLATLFGQRETALFLYNEMKKQSEAQEQLNQQRKAIFYASVDSTLYGMFLFTVFVYLLIFLLDFKCIFHAVSCSTASAISPWFYRLSLIYIIIYTGYHDQEYLFQVF